MAKKQSSSKTDNAKSEISIIKKIKKPKHLKIDNSDVPGIKLSKILHGHLGNVRSVEWSPNGKFLASVSGDKNLRLWDIETDESYILLEQGNVRSYYLAWSPDSRKLAFHFPNSLGILNIETHEVFILRDEKYGQITWSPDGKNLLIAGNGKLWDCDVWKSVSVPLPDYKYIVSLLWLDNQTVAIGTVDGYIMILDIVTHSEKVIEAGKEHIYLAWSPTIPMLASGSSDKTIKLWNPRTWKQIGNLEGHTKGINRLSFSYDGQFLATKAWDNTIRLWRLDTLETVAELSSSSQGFTHFEYFGVVADFRPNSNLLAATPNRDLASVHLWDINNNILLENDQETNNVKYITAKLVLVGDTGVGKTGLGWRLAHGTFKEQRSTHGQQFWVIPDLHLRRDDGAECEAILWDLAGQPDYRLVHSLYLDDVDIAMILFDPTNRQEPLAGVDFWLNQLKDKNNKLGSSILVGARVDRGASTLTNKELNDYCEQNGITGGYIPTSAINGNGIPELIAKLKEQVFWEKMIATVTTITFKRIKEYILNLKEKQNQDNVLIKPTELRKRLESIDKSWKFNEDELMTAVGHLETHGFVKIIRSSKGEKWILLAPDVLANLASSVVLEARRNPQGLGVLEEARLLNGNYPLSESHIRNEHERKILLDAVTVLFLERNVCFRETFNQQAFLVFPSLINEKRPAMEMLEIEEGEIYHVKGAIENIYASLVVLLGYTNTFIRTHQWQNQAQYELGEDEICGFQQSKYTKDGVELTLYYGIKTAESVRLLFRGLFERFLSLHKLEIYRYRSVRCSKCGSLVSQNVVSFQLERGKNLTFCHECGERLIIPQPEPLKRFTSKEENKINSQQIISKHRTAFEAALVRVKALLRDQGKENEPTCFISYAWGVTEHERWVVQFAKDLRNAGIDVLLDRWHSPPGADLGRYMDQIMKCDFVTVVGTPQLLNKYETQSADPVVAAELRLINVRLREPSVYGQTVIPLLLDGDVRSSFIPMLQTLVRVDFKQSAFYFRQLFDLIWRMYNLPFDNPLLEELQASMTPQDRS